MSLVCLVFAFVLFVIGASSRMWSAPAAPWPYFGHVVSAGLAFYVLAQLLPLILR